MIQNSLDMQRLPQSSQLKYNFLKPAQLLKPYVFKAYMHADILVPVVSDLQPLAFESHNTVCIKKGNPNLTCFCALNFECTDLILPS